MTTSRARLRIATAALATGLLIAPLGACGQGGDDRNQNNQNQNQDQNQDQNQNNQNNQNQNNQQQNQ